MEDIRATERYWFFGQNGALDFGVTGNSAEAFRGMHPIGGVTGS